MSVNPSQETSGNVNHPSSVKTSFSGPSADAGTEPPVTIRTIAATTAPLLILRIDTLLSTP